MTVLDALEALEQRGGEGLIALPGGASLRLTHLDKPYFPDEQITKGALLRYYARVAPVLLPLMQDRPLVLHRFPNGISDQGFYQQKAPEDVPDVVRTAKVAIEGGSREARVIGGDLPTLLWCVQNGVLSVDPWHSRIHTLDSANYAVLDLDPGPRAPFSRVVSVARCIHDVLGELALHGAVKTSGASGVHIYLPLPKSTSFESAELLVTMIAARVVERMPREATLERAVKARGASTVYVDCLQNVRGKTVAAAYAVRARPGAPVSTPLDWAELDDRIRPRDFTRDVVLERIAQQGDLWAKAMGRPNRLSALARPRRARKA
ncbi:MAG: non-homologous end-joining DNA ligase [Gemmatimonadaceae bacterium]